MASREFAEIEIIHEIAARGIDVAVGIIDVKSYYIETPADVADRVRLCLKHASAETPLVRARLWAESDCALGGSQKLANMVSGVADRPEGTGTVVIRPVRSNDALLADIRASDRRDGNFRLWWLGQSGFLLQWQGVHVLLDPYLSDSLTKKYSQTDKPHVRMTELRD